MNEQECTAYMQENIQSIFASYVGKKMTPFLLDDVRKEIGEFLHSLNPYLNASYIGVMQSSNNPSEILMTYFKEIQMTPGMMEELNQMRDRRIMSDEEYKYRAGNSLIPKSRLTDTE